MQTIIQPPFIPIENRTDISTIDFEGLSLEEIVGTSKYQKLLIDLKKTFKTELHAHLGGAVPIEFIAKHSTREEYFEFVKFVEQLKTGINYAEGFKAFQMISRVLNSNKRIEKASYAFCRNQHNDNVIFTELRTGLKRLDGGFEDYLKAVMAGLEKGMNDYPIQITLMLSLRRDTSIADANEIIDLAIKYRGKMLTGIDVSGESTKGDSTGIFEPLRRASANRLPITLHIGENPLEHPAQQIKELTEIQPSRVGHAVHLCPEAQSWIENRRIPIEACIRSALSVSMINTPSEHPALVLFQKGHPVIFCTDDSTLFGDLSEELALVACLCNLSEKEVTELQNNALTYAFKSE